MANRILIQQSPAALVYLDGYDGTDYEWTVNRKTAWRMSDMRFAKARLELVKAKHPEAFIIEV